MKKISFIFSAEFFFAAFLLAGYFKGGIPWFPIDITIFCLLVTGVFGVKRLMNNPRILKQMVVSISLFAAFTAIILISYLLTDSVAYANEKTMRYLLITAWSFIGVYVLINDKASLLKFIKSIILIAFIVSLVGFNDLISNWRAGTYNGTIFVMDTDYLALGRTVGLGLVLLVTTQWFSNQRSYKKTTMAMIIIMAVVILFSGGKMPLMSTMLTFFIITILATRFISKGKLVVNKGVFRLTVLSIIGTLLLLPVYLSGAFDNIFTRISSFFDGGDTSTLMRVVLYQTAIDMIKENPIFGTGWASFPLYFYDKDIKVYPHNIFLEVFSELGVFGLLFLVLLIMYAIFQGVIKYKKMNHKFNNIQLAIIGGFIFFLLNANTSGDLTDNKILLTFVALMTISIRININEEQDMNIMGSITAKTAFRNLGFLRS